MTNSPAITIVIDGSASRGNLIGYEIDQAGEVFFEQAEAERNRDGGIILQDVAAGVRFSNVLISDNNANHDSVGDGISILDGSDSDASSVSGLITFVGEAVIQDSDASGATRSQLRGVVIADANEIVFDEPYFGAARRVSGHQFKGVSIQRANQVSIRGGSFSRQQSGSGIFITDVPTVDLQTIEAFDNGGFGVELLNATNATFAATDARRNLSGGSSVANVQLLDWSEVLQSQIEVHDTGIAFPSSTTTQGADLATIGQLWFTTAQRVDEVHVTPSANTAFVLVGGDPGQSTGGQSPSDRLIIDAGGQPNVVTSSDRSIIGGNQPIHFSEFETARLENAVDAIITGTDSDDLFRVLKPLEGPLSVEVATADIETEVVEFVQFEIPEGQVPEIVGGLGIDTIEVLGGADDDLVDASENELLVNGRLARWTGFEELVIDLGEANNTASGGRFINEAPDLIRVLESAGGNTSIEFMMDGYVGQPRASVFDLNPNDEEVDELGTLVEGIGIVPEIRLEGIREIHFVGDGDDDLTLVIPKLATESDPLAMPLRVGGDGNSRDILVGAGNGRPTVTWSDMSMMTLESIDGFGAVEFELRELGGASSYTANVRSSDVVSLHGSDVVDDNLVIGRYRNAWHPVGARLMAGGPDVRIAGAGELRLQGGTGDDLFVVDVDDSRGSGLIAMPIYVDGGVGGFDTLEVIGEPAMPIETSEYQPGPDTHNGKIKFSDEVATPLMDIEFSGLEPAIVWPTIRNHIVRGSGRSEQFSLFYQQSFGVVQIDDKESYSFRVENISSPTSLQLIGQSGEDNFDLELFDSSPNGRLNVIEVVGDFGQTDRTGSNSVVLHGASWDESYRYEYNDPNNGSFFRDLVNVDRDVNGQVVTTYVRMTEVGDVTITDSGQDTLSIIGSDSDERLQVQLLEDGATPLSSPRRHAVQFEAVEGSSSRGTFTLSANAMQSVAGDLQGGIDEVIVLGSSDEDSIEVGSGQILFDTAAFSPVAVSNHERLFVETFNGNDRITLTEPIAAQVTVDGGLGDDRLIATGRSSQLTLAPLSGMRDGKVESRAQKPSDADTSLTYRNIDTLQMELANSDPFVNVFATGAANEITVTHPGLPLIQIDDRTTIELHGLGADANLIVHGLGGDDQFHSEIGRANTRLDGGEGGNELFIEANDLEYQPLGKTTRGARFANTQVIVTADEFDRIQVDAERVDALSRTTLPSRAYRVTGPVSPQARAFAYVVPREDGPIPQVGILRPDGSVIKEEMGGPTSQHSGVVFANGLEADDSHLFLEVQSPSGKRISDFEVFGGVIEPEEFVEESEPNDVAGEESSLLFGLGHRAGLRGSVAVGDTDLISVQIDHNHRVAAIVNNDPLETGQPIHSQIEILGSDGETVIATGTNVPGESGNGVSSPPLPAGTYYVRLTNDNAEAIGDYELLVLNVENARAVTDGLSVVDFERRADEVNVDTKDEIEPNDQTSDPIGIDVPTDGAIRLRGQVLVGDTDLVAVQIDNNHRIAAVVNNDPTQSLEFTQAILEVLGSDGETVIERGANLAGVSRNSLVTAPLPAGTYYVRLTNAVVDSSGNYELILFNVANESAFRDEEEGDGIPFSKPLQPGEHAESSVPPADSSDDLVQFTPLGNHESILRYNQSTPLELRNTTELDIRGADGSDRLETLGSPDSDTISLLLSDLIVNQSIVEHYDFESHVIRARSGDDQVSFSSDFTAGDGVLVDGGDGADRVNIESSDGAVELMLPSVIRDSRLIETIAVEAFDVDGSRHASDVTISGVSNPARQLTVFPETGDRLRLVDGEAVFEVMTPGTVTVSAVTPPLGSQYPIRSVQTQASIFDDLIVASDTGVGFDGVLKGFDLSNVRLVRVDAGGGLDTIKVEPSTTTRFFVDGGAPSGFGDKLELVTSADTVFWPGPENDEGSYQIDGAQPVSFDHIEETQVGPAPTNIVIDLDGTSNIPIADPQLINNIDLQRDGSNLLIHDPFGSFSHSVPLDSIGSVRIRGAATRATTVLVDYAVGSAFGIPGGIEVDGGGHTRDQLAVVGATASEVRHETVVSPTGPPKITLSEGDASIGIRFEGIEEVYAVGINRFTALGLLDVGSKTYSIDANLPVDLGPMTRVSGGLLLSQSSLILDSNEALIANGTIDAPVNGDVGSFIQATGSLSIGDSTSPLGFATLGEFIVGSHMVTIEDSNDAQLGALTEIGVTGAPGQLIAANGLTIDFGNNVTGFGTIDTPNDVNQRVLNNGDVRGLSSAEVLTLTGYVKGVGTLANVSVTGTLSPGLSPASVNYGALVIGETSDFVLEIGGREPGSSGYDQVNSTATMTIDGGIDVRLIDGFEPTLGDEYVLLNATEGLSGPPLAPTLPVLPDHLIWEVGQEPSQLVLRVRSNAPRVTSVDLGASASLLEEVALLINGNVDLVGNPFVVRQRGTGQLVETDFETSLEGRDTLIRLSFAGAMTRGNRNALVDGNYELQIDASKIVRAGTSVGLDGNSDGVAGDDFVFGDDASDAFFALFGDTDRDRDVDGQDYGRFANAFLSVLGEERFKPALDFESDGDIDGIDYGQFVSRFQSQLPFE
ncbi:MAG: right-handed parallel beta-helix repeat-containing protein [Planctomycetota bacterium]